MQTAIFSICSPLHKETSPHPSQERFIQDIERELGESFIFPDDFSSWGTHETEMIYVRTGGTEGLFKSLGLKGDIRLLTSGDSNSLAASMEILNYLRQRGQKGEILHGSAAVIAQRICGKSFSDAGFSSFAKPLPEIDLGGMRLGVIGHPSDWLISSDVDYLSVKEKFNAELVDIPISELIEDVRGKDIDLRSFEGSVAIFESLKGIADKYCLGGLTLRCFDLLDTVHNTGCLALARLNAMGIVSSCEGDIPALLSMAYLQKKFGNPGFQCNLSRINGDELLFAHCTVPLSMLSSYEYATHFESGIGTAIRGCMPLGKVEIFKISPDLNSCVSIPGEIVRNESFPNLCRTQIVVKAAGAADYFLHEPLANHHIVRYM